MKTISGIIASLAVLCLLSCRQDAEPIVSKDSNVDLASHVFTQFDQITAHVTASPLQERIAYNIRIKNIGHSTIEGHAEPRQQWQSHEKDPSNLTEWNEHIPMSDGVATFKLKPGEEFTFVATPQHIRGAMTRFGFLVLCRVGSEDYRRLAVWSEPVNPEYSFKSILGRDETNQ